MEQFGIAVIIIGVIIIILAFISALFIDLDDFEISGKVLISGIFTALIGISIVAYEKSQEPNSVIPAIEVYRGNTELKVIYIDTIPQDSIVVLKQSIKK